MYVKKSKLSLKFLTELRSFTISIIDFVEEVYPKLYSDIDFKSEPAIAFFKFLSLIKETYVIGS